MSTAVAIAASAPVVWRDRQRLMEKLAGCGFAFPAFLLLLLTNLVPLVVLLYLSFTNYELGALDTRFLGLDNFRKALTDPVLRRSLANTFVYVAIVLPGAVGLGLLVAVLLHRRQRSRSIYEVIYFLPVTSTLIAMATVWQFILHPRLGPVNGVLRAMGFAAIQCLRE